MSVGFATAVAAGLRHNDVAVTFETGYETRGNGFRFPDGRPAGLLIHHTGTDYDAGLTTLLQGRPDLDPPLCNSCGYADGRIHIIAAHPANHAGASGGRSMGPLPVTRLFNPQVWGHEIMYPGLRPMTPAQRHSTLVLGGVISGILERPSPEWVRAHAETSLTGNGKWDPGRGDGTTNPIDMNQFRADIWPALTSIEPPSEDDMPAGEWVTTPIPFEHLICYPVGPKVSGLTARAWLNIAANKPGDIRVEVIGAGRTLATWTDKLTPRNRWWRELPDGTEICSVTISTATPGVAGWSLELRARKDPTV